MYSLVCAVDLVRFPGSFYSNYFDVYFKCQSHKVFLPFIYSFNIFVGICRFKLPYSRQPSLLSTMVRYREPGKLKTYGKNKKGSQQSGFSKPREGNPIIINVNIHNYNLFLSNRPNSNPEGTSGSGDEFDKLLKGPIYQPPNQSSYSR